MAIQAFTDLYIADPDDANYPQAPTTRLVDFSDADLDAGGSTGFAFVDAPQFADDTFESTNLASFAHDGDQQAAHRHSDRVLEFSFIYKGIPMADAVEDLQTLAKAMRTGGVLVWQPRGVADPVYFDFKPSPIPQQLRGTPGGLFRIAVQQLEPTGIPLRFIVHPWPRTADDVQDAATVDNDAAGAGRAVALSNPGNQTSEANIEIDPSAGNLAGARISIRAHGNMSEYPDIITAPASGADFSDGYDTSSVVVADASGGSAALIDYATQAGHVKRFRDQRTVTDPTALTGVHRCYARLTPYSGTTRGRHTAQLRYGFTDDPYAMQVRPKQEFDFRDVNPLNFTEVELGLVIVPPGAELVNLDFYSGRISGDYEMAVDQLILEPADYYHAFCTIPGYRLGSWSRTVFDAEDLDGDGTLKRDTYRITQMSDLAHTETIPLAAGIHCFELEATIREPDDPGISDGDNPVQSEIGEFYVEETTGPAVVKSVELRNHRNRRWTRIERKIYFEVTSADVIAGNLYRAVVEFTAASLSGRRIQVHRFRHRFVRTVTTDSPIVLDSNLWLDGRDRGSRAVDASGLPLFPMILENDPPPIPPGDSVMVVSLIDMPTDPGYDDLDAREPVGRSVRDREATVTTSITPRWSHP